MNESLQAAIAAVEASNPTPTADAPPNAGGATAEIPADEQGNDAATGEEGQQADPSDESGDSAASDGDGAPAQRQNKGVGKRINELTREKYEAIRRAEAAEQRAKALEEKSQAGAAKQGGQGEKPKFEDFDFNHDAYVEALAEWRVKQTLAERETSAAERAQQEKAQEQSQQFQGRLAAFQAANPGKWEAAIQAPVNFTPPMLEVIGTSDIGPQIAVYLTENLDRAHEISLMTPYAAAAALGRLEASMGAAKASATPPKPTSVTKAPPPPSTVGGGSTVRKDLASMDVADHLEAVRAKRNR